MLCDFKLHKETLRDIIPENVSLCIIILVYGNLCDNIQDNGMLYDIIPEH